MPEGAENSGRWQDELYDLLRRNNITQFAYVPDAGHRILIDRSLADPGVHSVALTTEEEGARIASGIKCVSGSWFSPISPSGEAPAALKYRSATLRSP